MPSPLDDYYTLLGVHAGADGDALRRAWRRLAVRWHPDRAGAAATGVFQQISAAYAVLSDPVARAAYDRRRRGGAAHAPAPARTNAATGPLRQPAPEVMLSRLCGSITTLLACGAARYEGDDDAITLVLRAEEAARGGMVTISMWVELTCPACGTRQACARCGGTRVVEELFSAWLAIRPGVKAGEMLAPSATMPGMLTPVRFRIDVHTGS
jgi:molecular chaperone DnaJ